MIDLIQAQDDLLGYLLSLPQLANVNIVVERKFIIESEVQMDAVWQTVRNGKSGCGVLIEMPDITCPSPGVTGPVQTVEFSLVSFQNGDAALNPDLGGGLFAEQIEQYLVDALHMLSIAGLGTLQVPNNFSTPARDFPGINARRLKVNVSPRGTPQTPRTAVITVTVADGLATLACATPGASIYYTLDGSAPSDPTVAILPLSVTEACPAGLPLNPAATLYVAPFAWAPGTLIRAAAFAPGFNPGGIIRYPNC